MQQSQFNNLVNQGFNHIPLSREVVVDTDTPLALYLKLANTPFTYFLESVQGGEKWGRYSFIGLSAETIIKVKEYEVLVEKNGPFFSTNTSYSLTCLLYTSDAADE